MNWSSVYRYKPHTNILIENNLVYVPEINDDKNTLCLTFDHTHPYQNIEVASRFPEGREFFTAEVATYFFNQHVFYLQLFKDKPWSSNVLDVDYQNQKIYIDYPGHNCNINMFETNNLSELCVDWKDQLRNIILDINNAGYMNITIHPHSFFIQEGTMKHYDLYAVVPKHDPTIDFRYLKSVVMHNNKDRFMREVTDGKLNITNIFKQTIMNDSDWPEQSLSILINELFND